MRRTIFLALYKEGNQMTDATIRWSFDKEKLLRWLESKPLLKDDQNVVIEEVEEVEEG